MPRDAEGEILWPIAGQYVSDALTRVLQKMTRQNYSERYQSVEEVMNELMALEGQPTGSRGRVTAKVNHRFSVSLLVVFAAFLVGGLGFFSLSPAM
ncbi:MAG: hypothetical protein HC924_18680 [Synechococcaceae cyanobacterium SM2_3_2]|nr:hypothetical protein [Synechococcaceae cyanobacterium SM2_3_2]